MQVYFLYAQNIAPPLNEKLHHDVDLLLLKLVIQLTSQYPSNTTGKPK